MPLPPTQSIAGLAYEMTSHPSRTSAAGLVRTEQRLHAIAIELGIPNTWRMNEGQVKMVTERYDELHGEPDPAPPSEPGATTAQVLREVVTMLDEVRVKLVTMQPSVFQGMAIGGVNYLQNAIQRELQDLR